MKHVVTALLLLIPLALSAQENQMVDNSVAALARPFVPSGWKVIATAKGDLNKDAAEDIAVVIENTDKNNITADKDETSVSEALNTNPRHLLILFKDKSANGYTLAAKNESFVPPHDNPEIPCLTDPFVDAGGLEVVKGTLVVSTQIFWSCGSWSIENNSYTLRHQDGDFVLIGFDSHSSSRSTGEVTEVSINYLTKKKSTIEGGNMFDEEKNKPKTTWDKIKIYDLIKLSELNSATDIDY